MARLPWSYFTPFVAGFPRNFLRVGAAPEAAADLRIRLASQADRTLDQEFCSFHGLPPRPALPLRSHPGSWRRERRPAVPVSTADSSDFKVENFWAGARQPESLLSSLKGDGNDKVVAERSDLLVSERE